ncbi:unnamed protein product [Calypogeia fissa]
MLPAMTAQVVIARAEVRTNDIVVNADDDIRPRSPANGYRLISAVRSLGIQLPRALSRRGKSGWTPPSKSSKGETFATFRHKSWKENVVFGSGLAQSVAKAAFEWRSMENVS